MAKKKEENGTQLALTDTAQIEKIIQEKIKIFETYKADIIALAETGKGLKIADIYDVSGYEYLKKKRIELKNARVKIEKDGKAIRDILNRAKDSELIKERELLTFIEPIEKELQAEQDRIDNLLEEIEREKERLNKIRIDGLKQRLIDLGFAFNFAGQNFSFGEISISDFDLQIMPEDEFESFFKIAEIAINAKKKQDAEIKAEQEAEEKRKADELAAEKKKMADQQAEIDKQNAAIAENQRLLRIQNEKQEKELKEQAAVILREKEELKKQKNQAIFNRLISSGANAEDLCFDDLHLLTTSGIEQMESDFQKIKAEREEKERVRLLAIEEKRIADEKIRIEKEEKLNIAAVDLHDGTGWPVLECKNFIVINCKDLSDLKGFIEKTIKDTTERIEAEKQEAEAQKSDKLKLEEYIEKLKTVSPPLCKSKKWAKILLIIFNSVNDFDKLLK